MSWYPDYEEHYFFINNQGLIGYRIFLNTNTDKVCKLTGNMFQTEDQAEFVLELIKDEDIQERINEIRDIILEGV